MIAPLLFIFSTHPIFGADLVWTNAASGNWQTAANWSPNQVPGPNDNATLSLNVRVTNNASVAVSNFTFSGATFVGSGFLTINGTGNWTSGDLCTAIVVATNASLVVSNTVSMSLTAVATDGSLTNHGTVVWSGVNFYGYGGSVIHNAGLWQSTADNNYGNQSGTNTFYNAGTFQKAAGTGTTTVGWKFNNTGTMDVQTGTIHLSDGFTGNGIFSGAGFVQLNGNVNATINGSMNWSSGNIGSGSVLNIAAGATLTVTNNVNHDLPGATLNNAGTVVWMVGGIRGGTGTVINNSGLWHAQGDSDIHNAFGGTINFTNSGTFRKSVATGTTTLTGVAFNNSGIVNMQNGTLNFAGGLTGNGTFSGAGYVQLNGNVNATVNGSMNWSGGSFTVGSLLTMNGTVNWSGSSVINGSVLSIATNGVLNLVSNFNRDLPGTTLNNSGTVVWLNGSIRGGTGTVINNSGLWHAQGANDINNAYSGACNFTNSGIFRKSVLTGITPLSGVAFNNTGTVDVQTGTLGLDGGFTGNGNFTGAGFVRMNGSVNATINGSMNWSEGNISSGSVLNIATNAVLTVTNNVNHDLPGATLNNAGTVMWMTGTIRGGTGSVINNSGLWHAQGDSQMNNAYGGIYNFTNSGTFRKSVATGTTTLSGATFNNTGTVDVQTGTINLGSGLTGNGTFSGAGMTQLSGNVNATINGSMNWSDGNISSGSVLNIATNTVLTVTNNVNHDFPGTTLNGLVYLTNA